MDRGCAVIVVRCPSCRRKLPIAPETTNFAICSCGYRIIHATERLQGSTFDQETQARLKFLQGLWHELHGYTNKPWDIAEAKSWLALWVAKIPSFGCSCAQHFREIYDKRPPDFSSPEAFYRWGVAVHNDVNKLLGKPLWEPAMKSLSEQACVVCNKPSTRICSYTLSIGMCGSPLCDDCTHTHTL